MPTVAGAGVLAVVIVAGLSGRGGATSADATVPNTVAGVAVPTSAGITTLPIVVNTDPAIVKNNIALPSNVTLNSKPMYKVDLSAFPKLMAFQARVAARPAVLAALVAEGLVKAA